MIFNSSYSKNKAIMFLQDSFLPDDFVAEESEIYLGSVESKPIKEANCLGYCESLDLKVLRCCMILKMTV